MFAFQLQRSSQFSRRHTIGIYFKSNRVWLNSLVLAGGNYLVPNFNLRCWRRGGQRSRVPGGKRTGFHLKLTYYLPKCKLRKEILLNIGRDPFNQNFRKFRSKIQWISSVQPEKFRKNGSTF